MGGACIANEDLLIVVDLLIGDRLSIVADQLVLPFPGGIDVCLCVRGVGWVRSRGVGVDVLLRQVPPNVILVGHRLVGEPVVLPDQLVGAVIRIGDRDGAPGDRGYVPVVVVGVGVGRVAAVLVAGQQRLELSQPELSREPFP